MKTAPLISILAVIFFLISCAPPETATISKTTPSDAVIYDEDSRQDVTVTENLTDLAGATAILFEDSKIKHTTGALWFLNTREFGKSYLLCPDERFREQPVLGFCSGVLIAPNKVLTAAHCVSAQDSCHSTKFMFGWTTEKAQKSQTHETEVYHCKSLVKKESDRKSGADYAILELDRDVANAKPVSVAKNSALKKDDRILSLSYPMGIPLKKDLGIVLENTEQRSTFKAKIDTFSGSSGSPLFNDKNELIGILSSGMEDFLEDDIYRVQSEGGCLNFNRCKSGNCFGEIFFKTDHIDL